MSFQSLPATMSSPARGEKKYSAQGNEKKCLVHHQQENSLSLLAMAATMEDSKSSPRRKKECYERSRTNAWNLDDYQGKSIRRWSTEEDDAVDEPGGHHEDENWTSIAERFDGRIVSQSRNRWCSHLRPAGSAKEEPTAEGGEILAEAAGATATTTLGGEHAPSSAAAPASSPHTSDVPAPAADDAGACPSPLDDNPWTPEEDGVLRILVSESGHSDWASIASRFDGRSIDECWDRWNILQLAGVTAPRVGAFEALFENSPPPPPRPPPSPAPWTSEEDKLLCSAVTELGDKDWYTIADKFIPERTYTECWERWNVLKSLQDLLEPEKRRENPPPLSVVPPLLPPPSEESVPAPAFLSLCGVPWTPEEDALLRSAVEELGDKRWGLVADRLDGRSCRECHERWFIMNKPKEGLWSPEEDKLLRSVVNELGDEDWENIANRLGTRTAQHCRQRWNSKLLPGLKKGRWTTEEDELLRSAVAELGDEDWEKIANRLDTRAAQQCRQRWNNQLQSGLKKGRWTPEEDAAIIKLVKKHGTKWTLIAKLLGGKRSCKQYSERWLNNLDPALKKGEWTEEEDRALVEAHTRFGNRWVEIAKRLPGRSKRDIKNRWYFSNALKPFRSQHGFASRPESKRTYRRKQKPA